EHKHHAGIMPVRQVLLQQHCAGLDHAMQPLLGQGRIVAVRALHLLRSHNLSVMPVGNEKYGRSWRVGLGALQRPAHDRPVFLAKRIGAQALQYQIFHNLWSHLELLRHLRRRGLYPPPQLALYPPAPLVNPPYSDTQLSGRSIRPLALKQPHKLGVAYSLPIHLFLGSRGPNSGFKRISSRSRRRRSATSALSACSSAKTPGRCSITITTAWAVSSSSK